MKANYTMMLMNQRISRLSSRWVAGLCVVLSCWGGSSLSYGLSDECAHPQVASATSPNCYLVPLPNQMHWENGYFPFTRQTIIACTVVDEGIKKSACYLTENIGVVHEETCCCWTGHQDPPKKYHPAKIDRWRVGQRRLPPPGKPRWNHD